MSNAKQFILVMMLPVVTMVAVAMVLDVFIGDWGELVTNRGIFSGLKQGGAIAIILGVGAAGVVFLTCSFFFLRARSREIMRIYDRTRK